MIDYAGPETIETGWRRFRRLSLRALARVGFTLLGLSIILGISAIFHFGIGSITTYIGFYGGVLLLGGLASMQALARRRRGRVVLAHLGQAVSLALPIPQMLRAAAESEPASVRQRLIRVAEGIEQGGGVASVLTTNLPEIPARALSLVAVAESNGVLSKGIDAALDSETRDDPARPPHHSLIGPMLLATLFVGVIVMLFVGILLVPRLALLLHESGVGAPASLRTFLQSTNLVVWLAPFLMVLAVLWLLWFAARKSTTILFDAPHREPGWLARGVQRLRWSLPLLGQMDRDRGYADALSAVADAVAAGRSLPTALREAAMPHLNVTLRERLRDWAEAIERGGAFSVAARDARMPAALCALLPTARDTDSVAAALRFAAVTSTDRWTRHAAWWRELGQVALTLLIGLLVAMLGFALFDTMSALSRGYEPIIYQYP